MQLDESVRTHVHLQQALQLKTQEIMDMKNLLDQRTHTLEETKRKLDDYETKEREAAEAEAARRAAEERAAEQKRLEAAALARAVPSVPSDGSKSALPVGPPIPARDTGAKNKPNDCCIVM